MNLLISTALLLTPLSLWLISARPKANTSTAPEENQQEIRALIHSFNQQRAQLDPQQTQRLDELEARLYHELQPLIHPKTARPLLRLTKAHTTLLILITLTLSTAAWYYRGGYLVWQWQQLDNRLSDALTRSQYLDELPQNLPREALATYCLALQNRIDRQNPSQLDTLAQCLSEYGNYHGAREVYHVLYRQNPNDSDIALNYVQMTLFSQQGQPIDPEILTLLERLYRLDSQNHLAGILLASAYTQNKQTEQALTLWQQLLDTLPQNHPLYTLAQQTYHNLAQSSPNNNPTLPTNTPLTITVSIDPALLKTLPPQSQLYVLASPLDSRMPIAVKRLSPQVQQTLTLSDSDSMQGQSLSAHEHLTIRALISLDGQANGQTVAEQSQTLTLPTTAPLSLELKAHAPS